MSTIRFGVAGLGAARHEMAALAAHPHVRIAAVADIDRQLSEEMGRKYGASAYDSVEALCGDPAIDAVFIGTPTYLHTDHALLALDAGKHVIVAKPMALSLADADRMIQSAERNGLRLMVGHTQAYEPAVRRLRELISGGRLGAPRLINTWYYTDWLYRGRAPSELDTSRGGGVIYRQAAHQIDIVRLLGGGLVRSVRAMAGVWDSSRPTEGAYATFLDFVDGAAATAVFNGYDHFHTVELGFHIGEGGQVVEQRGYGEARADIRSTSDELSLKQARRSDRGHSSTRHQSFYGLTIVSCEHADVRQSSDGLLIYGDEGAWEEPLPAGVNGRDVMVDEFYRAIVQDQPVPQDGRWGKATLEACLGILQSTRLREEIPLTAQVPFRPLPS